MLVSRPQDPDKETKCSRSFSHLSQDTELLNQTKWPFVLYQNSKRVVNTNIHNLQLYSIIVRNEHIIEADKFLGFQVTFQHKQTLITIDSITHFLYREKS